MIAETRSYIFRRRSRFRRRRVRLSSILIEDVEIRKKLAAEKPISKGYNSHKSGHVRSNLFMKRIVLPSMKRVNVYLDFLPPFLGASPDGITERGSLVAIKKVASKDLESREDVGLVFAKEMLRKLF